MLITDDLFYAFLRCETKAYMLSRAATKDGRAPHPIVGWQEQLAEHFRRECRDLLTGIDPAGCFIGNPSRHDLAVGQHHYIVDPILTFEDMRSHIDALERVALPLPEMRNRYIPVRFISSEKVAKEDKIRLAFDALILGKICEEMPISGKLIHRKRKTAMSVKLTDLIRSAENLVRKIRMTLADSTAPDLALIAHCSECEFEARCRSKASEDDNLSLLGGMSAKEVKKLHRRGIFTVTQLSYTFRPRKKSKRSNKVTVRYYQALKALAIRESRIYVAALHDLNISGTPVYLDVEGIPEREFYYLIGMRLPGIASTVQRSLWANDSSEEETIWREFLYTIATTENPQLFHYGSYETAFLRRMTKRYGDKGPAGISVDRLIQGAQNVLSSIYGRVYFPTYANGLKDIASFLGFRWSTKNPSGLRSLVLRHQWELSGSIAAKEELIAYNADDCEALELVTKAVQQIHPHEGGGGAAAGHPAVIHVDSLKPTRPYSLGRVNFAFPELDKINKCAYWDYQRDRIYIRTNPGLKRISRLRERRSLPVNVTLCPSRPRTCPSCNSKMIEKNGRHSRLIYDLRFSAGGVKRWVSRYITDYYRCRHCGGTFVSDQYKLTKHRYGPQLLAYVIYNIIELHIPQFKLAGIIGKIFHYPIGQPTINRMKRRAVELYHDTYQEIKADLLGGKLIHADETHVSVKGNFSYIWVFTSMREVIYIWSETRKGSVAGKFFRTV
jgi:predicted RecB family nuclease